MQNDFDLSLFDNEPIEQVPESIGFDPYLDLLPGFELLGEENDNQSFLKLIAYEKIKKAPRPR